MTQNTIFRKLLPVITLSAVAFLTIGGLSPSEAQSTPAATGSPTAAATPDNGSPSVTIMVGGLGKIIYMPAELTEVLGFYTAQGLNVTISDQPVGADATTLILAGKVDGVIAFYDHTIDAQGAGKLLESVVQFSNVPGEYVMVSTKAAAQITSPADFKNHTFGVGALGSSTPDLLTRFLALQAGVNPGTLNRIVTGDAGAGVISAFEKGKIDVALVTEPTASQLIQKGDAQILIDLSDPASAIHALGGEYPGASLYFTSDYIAVHPAIVQKLVNALINTLRWIHTHSAAQIADALPAAYIGADKALYIAALTKSLPMYSIDGTISAAGIAHVLTVENALNRHVQSKSIDLTRTYTNDFANAANLALGPLPTMAATSNSP